MRPLESCRHPTENLTHPSENLGHTTGNLDRPPLETSTAAAAAHWIPPSWVHSSGERESADLRESPTVATVNVATTNYSFAFSFLVRGFF